MERAVEQQISAFVTAEETANKQYLYTQWTRFLSSGRQSSPGSLTTFLTGLQRSEATKVFVPKRMPFRQLSANSPYAAPTANTPLYGYHQEVQPASIALRLISCRESLAEYWLGLMPSLSSMQGADAAPGAETGSARDVSAAPANATLIGETLRSYDAQLLRGVATKLAARQMLKELAMRPSCKELHAWLESFLLVEHANDLSALGSVERLHARLVAQPMCFRGGAIFDPSDVSTELVQRSVKILELIEQDLQAAPAHIVPLTTDFLEKCYRL